MPHAAPASLPSFRLAAAGRRGAALIAAVFMLLCIAGSLLAPDAQAKRLGGGRSIGRQHTVQVQPQPAPAPMPAVAPARPSLWRGVVGGLLAGVGLGMLLQHGGGLTAVLLIALLALGAWMLVRRATAPRQAAGAPAWRVPNQGYDLTQLGQESWQAPPRADPRLVVASEHPGFDRAQFLDAARQQYFALQRAWDTGDLEHLRGATTPELFEQFSAEIAQRGGTPERTEVVTLQAILLDLRRLPDETIASVEFSGLVREQSWGGAQPVREIWNLLGSPSGEGPWRLAGIQQLS